MAPLCGLHGFQETDSALRKFRQPVETILLTYLQHIIDMWNGRITRRDGSLRLLLIIDYVFDWARDIYRPNILHDLKTLVARDTAGLAEDSDIFSSTDPAQQIDIWLSKS